MNSLKQLEQFGQSVWLDFLSREFLAGAEFRRMLAEDGIKGMTSNPSICLPARTNSLTLWPRLTRTRSS